MSVKTITQRNIARISRELASSHMIFQRVYEMYGAPPLWDRPSGFTTLLQIILEQQVSLASAKACYDKLEAYLGDVTPTKLLTLDDVALKKFGFSRQKTSYARHLAEAILQKRLDLDRLHASPDAEAKAQLTALKGIGEWTSDIYLLMAMLRPDIMPKGDIALHSAWHRLSGEPKPSSEAFVRMAERWRPFRSVAARLLWHFYLEEKKNNSVKKLGLNKSC